MDSLAVRDDHIRLRRRSVPRERGVLDEVFEHLQHGVAVTDRVGAVLVSNRALVEILQLEDDAEGWTCCDLFGCGTSAGPRGGCLTEQAIRAAGQPVETVIHRASAEPVWVTVAPLRDDGSRLVFEVRHVPGHGTHAWQTARLARQPRVQVFTLGRTEVRTQEGPVSGDWLDQRPGQVLKYLICERRRVVPADEIAECLCRYARHATLNTVRSFVHSLREKLDPDRRKHGRASVVVARHGGYMINDAEVWTDADEFEAQVNAGMAALVQGERAAAAQHLETAVSLYQGDFLADEPYAEWALNERERLRTLVEKPLRALAELHADDPDAAAGYLERLAQMEPFDGDVQRELLSLWVRQGRLSRVARHYRAFRERMVREFGMSPAFNLSDLMSHSLR